MSLNRWIDSLTEDVRSRRRRPGRRRSIPLQKLVLTVEESEILERRTLLVGDSLSKLWLRDARPSFPDEHLVEQGPQNAAISRASDDQPSLQAEPHSAQVDDALRAVRRPKMLGIVDGGIEHSEVIVDAIGSVRIDNSQMEVVVLDPSRDGLEQMTQILRLRSGLTAVHLFSHGDRDSLQLGSTTCSARSLADMTAQLEQWAKALSPDAEILLYGCRIGAGQPGIEFIHALPIVTRKDVTRKDVDSVITGDTTEAHDVFDDVPRSGDTVEKIEETSGAIGSLNSPRLTGDTPVATTQRQAAAAGGNSVWSCPLVMHAAACAQTYLQTSVETIGGNFPPSVTASIHYTQLVGELMLSTSSDASFGVGCSDAVLQDVILHVGTRFNSSLGNTLEMCPDNAPPTREFSRIPMPSPFLPSCPPRLSFPGTRELSHQHSSFSHMRRFRESAGA